MPSTSRIFRLNALLAATAIGLTGCFGGGSDDGPAPAPSPAPAPAPAPGSVTLSGQVTRNAALQNVVVCLDTNANNQCDTGEPASAPTGADGMYSLSATEAQAAASRLIAIVRAGDASAATTAIDAANPGQAITTVDYVLTRPAGSTGGINPLTTLVQAGVAAGMTEAAARGNVAIQLGIAQAKIDGYQDDPAYGTTVQDSARAMAAMTARAIQAGATLEVGDQQAAVAMSRAGNQLSFTDTSNYFVQSLEFNAKAAGADLQTYSDQRKGAIGGVPRSDGGTNNALYNTAMLSATGWQYCNRSAPASVTQGNPSRAVYCGARPSVSFSEERAVAGEAMAALVTRWQTAPGNTINPGASTASLNTALGAASFPAGSMESLSTSLVLMPPMTIDNLRSRAIAQARAASLGALPAGFKTADVDLSNPGPTTLSLALGSAAHKAMRVAFGPATDAKSGAVQYYECDLDNTDNNFAVPPNCKTTTTGTYRIETVNGAPIMRFAGHPAVVDSVNYAEVVYTEIDWGAPTGVFVYQARQPRMDLNFNATQTRRLNQTALDAMLARLGL
ncbi:MAG: hypothetical protein BGO13_12545 [Burkholderiales bacterium 66-5]|nr:MAG: hypothetical protein BGO13_12545 [Burkholderiales bacterium 66-5]